MSATVVAHKTPVLADAIPGARVRDVTLVLAGAAFITLAGYIAIPLPFTPVPLSLATFAVLLTGAAMGPVRGASSAALYLLIGIVGVPVFAGGGSGWAFSSFGYILGYVLAASIVGLLARTGADRNIWSTLGLAALGTAVIYTCGVPWLAIFLGVDFPTALALGVLPFLVGDTIKILATALVLPSAWKLIKRT